MRFTFLLGTAFILSLILLMGCYTPNMKGPCCKSYDAQNGTCIMYTPQGPSGQPEKTQPCNNTLVDGGLTCETNFCVIANVSLQLNQTIYIMYRQGSSIPEVLDCSNTTAGNMSDPCNHIGYCSLFFHNDTYTANASYPVCSDRNELAFDTECKTMLCGNIKYQPKSSFLPETGTDPSFQNIGSSYSVNLYNAMCDFFVLDNKTMRKLKKGSGIFVDTYRFGLGEGISDYEEGRWYFPLSDRFCGFMPEDKANYSTDRYVNYLNLSDLRGCPAAGGGAGEFTGIYQMWNPTLAGHVNDHLYTTDKNEKPAGYIRTPQDKPYFYTSTGPTHNGNTLSAFYRCNLAGGDQYYTLDPACDGKNFVSVVQYGYIYPKIAGNNDKPPGTVKLIRFHSPDDGQSGECFMSSCTGDCSFNDYYLGTPDAPTQDCCGYDCANAKTIGYVWKNIPPPNADVCTARATVYSGFALPACNHGDCTGDCIYYHDHMWRLQPTDFSSPYTSQGSIFYAYSPDSSVAGTVLLRECYRTTANNGCPNIRLRHYLTTSANCGTDVEEGPLAYVAADGSGAGKIKVYECLSNENGDSATFGDIFYTTSTDCNGDSRYSMTPFSFYAWTTAGGSGVAYYGPFDPNTLKNRSLCMGDGSELDFPPAPDGNYLFMRFTEGNGKFASTYVMTDVPKYKLSLQFAYWNNMTGANNTNRSTYECNTSMDCISGLCAKDDYGYERGFCVRNATAGGSLGNCFCHEIGQRWHGGSKVLCEPYIEGPNPGYATVQVGGSTELASSIIFYKNKTNHNGNYGFAVMDPTNFTQTKYYQACGGTYENVTCCLNVSTPSDCSNLFSDEGNDPCCPKMEAGGCATPGTKTTKVVIKDLGSCISDDGEFFGVEADFPKLTGVYGWCESCTFATMMGINMDEYWKKFQRVTASGKVKAYNLNCEDTACGDNVRTGFVVGINDKLDDCDQCGWDIRNYMRNLGYLRTRMDNYHKAGTMPVVWYVDGNAEWTNVTSGPYEILQDCTNNLNNEADASPAIAQKKIKEVLLGSYFYYYPDFGPLFENVDAQCWVTTRKDCGTSTCEHVITASSASSYGALGEFGTGTPSTDYSTNGISSNETQVGLLCPPWNEKTLYSMWCTWKGSYHFLKRALGNSASVVIVATDNMSVENISYRAKTIKTKQCPNCLVALYSPNVNLTRLDEIFGCNSGEAGCRLDASHTDAWTYIDTIAYDFRPNDFDASNLAGQDRNNLVLDGEVNFSRILVQRYGKPSFAYNFRVDDNANNWDAYPDTYSTMQYLLENQSDIVNSGMFAFFYKKWFREDDEALVSPMGGGQVRPPTLKDDKFCAMERTIDTYLNPLKRKTVLQQAQAFNASAPEVMCVPCTSIDVMFGECSTMCENGVDCTPEAHPDPDVPGYKCPKNVAVEPCTMCKDAPGSVTCNLTYTNNSVDVVTVPMSDLQYPQYGDFLASLPKDKRCCLLFNDTETNETYNYTFAKITGEGLTATPVRYPKTGNETLDCGLSKDVSEFCGVKLPIRDYKVECAVVP